MAESVPGLFGVIAQIIRKYPDCPAIRDEGRTITFADLKDNAQVMRGFLLEEGLTAGDTIAVCLPRTGLLPATLYAILRNGYAYIFLDPLYPTERLQYYLDTAEPSILLTDQNNIDRFQLRKKVSIPFLQSSPTPVPEQDYPLSTATAYVMFTSGSTGAPKGIRINHTRLNKYLVALAGRINLSPDDIYLHTASFSFSSSVRQFLLPLFSGCTQYIAKAKDIADPLQLADLIIRNGITILDTSPSYWPHALNLIEVKGDIKFLEKSATRLMVFSGSVLHYGLVNDLKTRCAFGGAIMNVYGQTEALGVSSYLLPFDTLDKNGIVPVGRVYDDVDYFIEDDQLLVTMPGLADCYLNYQNSAFRYRRHHNEGKMIFQTGDIARELDDGVLELRGRTDDQVKINGVRVELSEIEAVLQEERGVSSVVVIYHGGRLIAYLSLATQSSCTEKKLLIHAGRKLISWMLPSELRLLEDFPRLPNSKIDRMALRKSRFYDNARKAFSAAFKKRRFLFYGNAQTTPLSDTEQKLLSIWKGLLSREKVSLDDNFFQIGGDSLLAMELLLAIENEIRGNVSIDNLYKYSTIRTLALWISSKVSSYTTPVYDWAFWVQQADSTAKTLFWCGHFKASWRSLLKEYSVVAFKSYFSPWHTLSCHPESVEELAAYYLEDIKRIQPAGPYCLAGYSGEGIFTYEVARRLTEEGQKVAVFLLDPPATQNLLTVYGKLRSFLSLLHVDRFPAYINYCLYRNNLVKRMVFGATAYKGLQRTRELKNKYSVVRIPAAIYLIQTPLYSKKTQWYNFLAGSCSASRIIPATHMDLLNQKTVIRQWIDTLKEMLQTDG